MPLSWASFQITPCPPGLHTGENGLLTSHCPSSALTVGTRGWWSKNYKLTLITMNKTNKVARNRTHQCNFQHKTCSKSWKLDRSLPNQLSLSQREVIRSWLFLAELVIMATGVIHCFPYILKYKNSLALQLQTKNGCQYKKHGMSINIHN